MSERKTGASSRSVNENRFEEALWQIHQREWPAGDKKAGARHAAEMWAIADAALQSGRHALSGAPGIAEHCHKLIGQLFEKPATRIRLNVEDVDLIKRALTIYAGAFTSHESKTP